MIEGRANAYDEAMWNVVSVVMVACVALSAPATAGENSRAGDGRTFLARGIQLYREASYAESVAALEQARAHGGLEEEQLVECAFYLGAGYVALNSVTAARRELKRVLAAQPGYEPPQYTSPKVAALFHDVREELEKQPRLRPLPPERRARSDGGGFVVRFEASRTGGRAFGVVEWRWRGEKKFAEAPLVQTGALLEAQLPVTHEGTLEYFAIGQAPSGPLAAGSAAEPLELPVTRDLAVSLRADLLLPRGDDRERSPSKARRLWWVWTGVSALAAAGAGVGLYFALRPAPSGTAEATLSFQVH